VVDSSHLTFHRLNPSHKPLTLLGNEPLPEPAHADDEAHAAATAVVEEHAAAIEVQDLGFRVQDLGFRI